MEYLEENIDPEILDILLSYLNNKLGSKKLISLKMIGNGLRSNLSLADMQLGLDYLIHLKLINSRELKVGGYHYAINQLGKGFVENNNFQDFFEKKRKQKQEAIESDKMSQKLVLTQLEALKLNIQDLEKRLSAKSQITEERLKVEQSAFFVSTRKKNNQTIITSYLAIIISVISIAIAFFK